MSAIVFEKDLHSHVYFTVCIRGFVPGETFILITKIIVDQTLLGCKMILNKSYDKIYLDIPNFLTILLNTWPGNRSQDLEIKQITEQKYTNSYLSTYITSGSVCCAKYYLF